VTTKFFILLQWKWFLRSKQTLAWWFSHLGSFDFVISIKTARKFSIYTRGKGQFLLDLMLI